MLVTGSRDFDDVSAIRSGLEYALGRAGARPMVVVHGDCPSGADWHADHVARWMRGRDLPVDVERHPAKGHPTENFGPWPGCGPRRNAYMVRLGADLCLAFVAPCARAGCSRPGAHGSHGTTHCADLAERAGIPVRRWAS